MTYLVLARKWRPRTFSELVGQEHVVRALVNALDGDRVHHAFLFTGTRGVGKTTIARIISKALNCEKGVSSTPCGECASCCEIDEGRFVDLIEVDAASRTRVDDTRELLDNVQYAPTRGRYKVYLIDEVHMLSAHSFNALLKTLEEPPPHVKFLLATTDPQKIPVTVLSRCLQFNLKRLPLDLIQDRLVEITGSEKIEAEAAGLNRIARAATGSMRDALSLLDQAIAYGAGSVKDTDVQAMIGAIDQDFIVRLVTALVNGNADDVFSVIGEMDGHAVDYSGAVEQMLGLLQKAALVQLVPNSEADDAFDPDSVAAIAASGDAESLQLYYQIALTGRRDLNLAADPRSGFEMLLLRMLAFAPVEAGSRTAGPEPAKKAPAPRRSVAKKAPAKKAPGKKLATGQWPVTDWHSAVQNMPLKGAAGQLAANCVLDHVQGDVLHLTLDREQDHLLTDQIRSRLRDAAKAHFGRNVKLKIALSETKKKPASETPAKRKARKEDARQEEAREAIESDPNVQALKDAFGATVRPDSIEPIN